MGAPGRFGRFDDWKFNWWFPKVSVAFFVWNVTRCRNRELLPELSPEELKEARLWIDRFFFCIATSCNDGPLAQGLCVGWEHVGAFGLKLHNSVCLQCWDKLLVQTIKMVWSVYKVPAFRMTKAELFFSRDTAQVWHKKCVTAHLFFGRGLFSTVAMGDSMSAMLFAFCHLSLESLDVSLDVSSLTFDGLSVIRTIGHPKALLHCFWKAQITIKSREHQHVCKTSGSSKGLK